MCTAACDEEAAPPSVASSNHGIARMNMKRSILRRIVETFRAGRTAPWTSANRDEQLVRQVAFLGPECHAHRKSTTCSSMERLRFKVVFAFVVAVSRVHSLPTALVPDDNSPMQASAPGHLGLAHANFSSSGHVMSENMADRIMNAVRSSISTAHESVNIAIKGGVILLQRELVKQIPELDKHMTVCLIPKVGSEAKRSKFAEIIDKIRNKIKKVRFRMVYGRARLGRRATPHESVL